MAKINWDDVYFAIVIVFLLILLFASFFKGA